MGHAPAVEFRQVSKRYNAFEALKDIDLSVAAGERVVICGPSGSGKSTLIRCINQLETHQAGDILVHGHKVHGTPANVRRVRQMVGMVFQQFNLYPHMTVLENCMIAPLLVRRISKKQAEENAMLHLNRVRIADQARKYPHQLSGGQQQRVAIARALCMESKVMLFDEPTSALDPEMIAEVLDVMVRLAESGLTMICVTHEMGFARQVADRIAFMDRGQIVEVASPTDFFTDQRNERTRTFLSQILH